MRVAINGAAGKIGRELVKAMINEKDIQLCGASDISACGKDIGELAGIGLNGIMVKQDVGQMLDSCSPDILVDFTNPDALKHNLDSILRGTPNLIIGTSGVSKGMVNNISEASKVYGSRVIIAPNFAIGAVLLMKFSKIAAEYMPDVEIIEMHHNQKLDAPSGTAIRTAELIESGRLRENDITVKHNSDQNDDGFRGGKVDDVVIHSVRLPGLVAHQQVIFGGLGQTLTLRHDSINRESFMPGVLLAIRKITSINGVVYGLENLL